MMYSGVFIRKESMAAVLNSAFRVKPFLNSAFAVRGALTPGYLSVKATLKIMNGE